MRTCTWNTGFPFLIRSLMFATYSSVERSAESLTLSQTGWKLWQNCGEDHCHSSRVAQK